MQFSTEVDRSIAFWVRVEHDRPYILKTRGFTSASLLYDPFVNTRGTKITYKFTKTFLETSTYCHKRWRVGLKPVFYWNFFNLVCTIRIKILFPVPKNFKTFVDLHLLASIKPSTTEDKVCPPVCTPFFMWLMWLHSSSP